jgi:PPOX class probable F420-dependent enzyme
MVGTGSRSHIGGAAADADDRKVRVMTLLSAPAQALLGSDAVAHVWTNNADGSPQVSVVWVIVDGDEVLFGSDRDSWKIRNLRRDPHIVMSIEDETQNEHGFQRHLVVRGRATIQDGANPGLMDRLAKKYTGLDRHPLALRDSPSAVTVRVTIDRISGVGPWVDFD